MAITVHKHWEQTWNFVMIEKSTNSWHQVWIIDKNLLSPKLTVFVGHRPHCQRRGERKREGKLAKVWFKIRVLAGQLVHLHTLNRKIRRFSQNIYQSKAIRMYRFRKYMCYTDMSSVCSNNQSMDCRYHGCSYKYTVLPIQTTISLKPFLLNQRY